MQDAVSFSKVLALLEANGYKLLKRRTDASRPNAGSATFGRPGWPRIVIEVVNREVGYDYYKALLDTFGEEEESDEGGSPD